MQQVPLNDLRRSWLATDEEVLEICRRVVQSGWYVQGEEHARFEAEFAQFVGVQHARAVGNGTDALKLAMVALGCGPGDVVLTVANAGGYTSTAAAALGARCRYVDVDPRSLIVTPELVTESIASDVRLVVVTHLFGNLVDVPGVRAVCDVAGIPVIEDCAQAIGGRYGSYSAGSVGAAGTFSFYPSKNLGAAGDGGIVTTNRSEVARHVGSLRNYGWLDRYHIDMPQGCNSRLDELQAAILRLGLRRVTELNEARRQVVEQYRVAVAGSHRWIATGEGCATTAHLAVLVTEDQRDRQEVAEFMASQGIATDIHYPVLDIDQRGLPGPLGDTALEVSRDAEKRILTLPCFPSMTEDEVGLVVSALKALSG